MGPLNGDGSEAALKKRNGHAEIRTGLGAGAIAEALVDNLHYLQAKLPQHATRNNSSDRSVREDCRDIWDVRPIATEEP